jgi:hypothetical protein
LDKNEWFEVSEIMRLMSQFEKATKMFCGDKYPSISLFVFVTQAFSKCLDNFSSKAQTVTTNENKMELLSNYINNIEFFGSKNKNILGADEIISPKRIPKEIKRFRPVQLQQQDEPSTIERIRMPFSRVIKRCLPPFERPNLMKVCKYFRSILGLFPVFLNHFSLICLQSSKLRKWTNSKSRM